MDLEERRQKRSRDPLVALHYQLAHARRRGSLDAIVVADSRGVVVAGAGSWAMCEELAAYAPLLAQAEPRLLQPARFEEVHATRIDALRTQTSIARFEIDDQELLLCARGGQGKNSDLAATTDGVARILRAA
jgi:hypothetical protein